MSPCSLRFCFGFRAMGNLPHVPLEAVPSGLLGTRARFSSGILA